MNRPGIAGGFQNHLVAAKKMALGPVLELADGNAPWWQDHLLGSIDVGKFADFTVLDEDPLAVDPMALRHVRVHATVVGGEPFLCPR